MPDPLSTAANALLDLGERQCNALGSVNRSLAALGRGEVGAPAFWAEMLDLASREMVAACELHAKVAEAWSVAGAAALGVRVNPDLVRTRSESETARRRKSHPARSVDGRST